MKYLQLLLRSAWSALIALAAVALVTYLLTREANGEFMLGFPWIFYSKFPGSSEWDMMALLKTFILLWAIVLIIMNTFRRKPA